LANGRREAHLHSRAALLPAHWRNEAMSRINEKSPKWVFDTHSPEVSGDSAKLLTRFRLLSILGLVSAVFAAALIG